MTTEDPLSRLSAGLAEDERIARDAEAADPIGLDQIDWGPLGTHNARQDPASTLRRVEAIRDVVKECEALMRNATVVTEGYIAAESILARLASIYPEEPGC